MGDQAVAGAGFFINLRTRRIAAGTIFTSLPHRFEWTELVFGIPAIAAAYLYVIWRWAFGPEDRTLFKKFPGAGEAKLPS